MARAKHLALVALCLLPLRSASAAEGIATPFRVEYFPDADCPRAESFTINLLERSGHVRPALAREEGFVFRIDVYEEKGALRGRLELREPNGRETVRVVPGASCNEIMAALAVIAAVLVEPSADARANERDRASLPGSAESSAWGFGAGVGLVLQGGVSPELRSGIGVEGHATFDSRSILSPLFAFSYNWTSPDSVVTPSGTARLEWWAVRGSICPVRWPERTKITLRPCGLFDVGRLAATGERTERSASAYMTWVAAGGSARVDAAPSEGLWLTIEAGLVVPFAHDRFYFDPVAAETTAFEVPPVGALGRLGIAGHLE